MEERGKLGGHITTKIICEPLLFSTLYNLAPAPNASTCFAALDLALFVVLFTQCTKQIGKICKRRRFLFTNLTKTSHNVRLRSFMSKLACGTSRPIYDRTSAALLFRAAEISMFLRASMSFIKRYEIFINLLCSFPRLQIRFRCARELYNGPDEFFQGLWPLF